MDIDKPAAFLVVDVDGKMASYTGLDRDHACLNSTSQRPCLSMQTSNRIMCEAVEEYRQIVTRLVAALEV